MNAPPHKAVFNWSGGKDSALALQRVLDEGRTEITALLTTVNEHYGRISMHGVRESLLDLQAERAGLPLHKVFLPERPSMETYETRMGEAMDSLKKQGATRAVFGDIFLEDLRRYREEKLAAAGWKAVFPLWKQDTEQLAMEFIEKGFRAIVACVNGDFLDENFAGRTFDRDFLRDLPEGVDPCGEHGEFHSFVWDAPFFSSPLAVRTGEKVCRKIPRPVQAGDTKETVTASHDAGTADNTIAFWYCDIVAV